MFLWHFDCLSCWTVMLLWTCGAMNKRRRQAIRSEKKKVRCCRLEANQWAVRFTRLFKPTIPLMKPKPELMKLTFTQAWLTLMLKKLAKCTKNAIESSPACRHTSQNRTGLEVQHQMLTHLLRVQQSQRADEKKNHSQLIDYGPNEPTPPPPLPRSWDKRGDLINVSVHLIVSPHSLHVINMCSRELIESLPCGRCGIETTWGTPCSCSQQETLPFEVLFWVNFLSYLWMKY